MSPAKPIVEAAVDRVVARFDRTDGPGLAIGLLQDGEVVFRKGYGLADMERGCLNGPDVPMRIASLSKQFLCTVVAMLDREGALSVGDDICSHLPWLPDYGHRITLADLMANQGGIRDFLELRLLSGGDLATPVAAEASLDLVRAVGGLNFEPGSDFAYSNTGFMLLSLVVEAVEGRPLENSLQARIFAPLGMTQTRLVRRDEPPIPGRAQPYVETAAGFAPGLWGVPLDGAGGVVSTIDDLLIWAKNLRNPTVGTAEMFATMTRARPFNDGTPSIYGQGFSTLRYRGQPTFGHHGQLPGLFAEIAVYPDLDSTIVLIANTCALNPFVIGRQIADAVLGERLGPKAPDPVGSSLDGLYRDVDRHSVLEISSAPDGAVTVTTAMMDAPLEAPADGRLAMMWPMSLFDVAPTLEGDLAGTAGPRRVRFARLPVASPRADVLDAAVGRFYRPELRTAWIIERIGDALRLRMEGPCGTNAFDLQAVAPDLFQARMREEPCGPYRPVFRLSVEDGRRRLSVITDRTRGLAAEEVPPAREASA